MVDVHLKMMTMMTMNPESFRSYTSAWLDIIDRGGLFQVCGGSAIIH